MLAEANEDVRLSPRADEPAGEISSRAAGEAVGAIRRLAEKAEKFSPANTRLVATSIVRESRNADDFCARVFRETGCAVDVLSGEAEALAIAAGVATDPAVAGIAGAGDLFIVDLGGGSMECILKKTGAAVVAESFPLGAVRLTRRFFPSPENPIPPAETEQLAAHVRAAITGFFQKTKPARECLFVGCGGAFSVAGAIFAARAGRAFDAPESAKLPADALRALRDELSGKPIAERMKIQALPASRADILPAALTTILVLAELAGAEVFLRSRHNLRYGIAAGL